MYQGLWNENKAVHTEKFIVVSAFIRKEERSQLSNLNFLTKKLEKIEQSNPMWKEGSK